MIFLVLVFSKFAFAQDFAPIGAVWHYTHYTMYLDYISYSKLESLKDTVIQGTSCRKLLHTKYDYESSTEEIHYMFRRNDSLFFYAADDFHLLYDFGAVAGDSVVLDYYTNTMQQKLTLYVESTDSIMIGNEKRKVQYVTTNDGLCYEFSGDVIDGIGNAYYMFPCHDMQYDGPLRCYKDQFTGLYMSSFYPWHNWNHEDCEEILLLDIDEHQAVDPVHIYPNPASTGIKIELDNEEGAATINLINASGQTALSIKAFSFPVEVNTQALSPGMYQIQIIKDEKNYIRTFIKKND